jgi:NTE family protein
MPESKETVFINQPEVLDIMAKLEQQFGPGGERLKMSDVVDDKGNQYVNLVQEGGGVLGIALVGFTYVLEKMGIRFWRLAGTSAGAINTLMLACIGTKADAKSEQVLRHLASKPLIEFVDGYHIIPKVLTKLIRNKRYLKDMMFFVGGLASLLILCMFFGAMHHSKALVWFILIMLAIIAAVGLYIKFLWGKFKKRKWGICRGQNFHDWIKGIIAKEGIHSLKDMKDRAYITAHENNLRIKSDSLQARSLTDASVDSLQSDVTMIACDITTQMKVEFPRMAMLYGKDDSCNPSDFVRASMSIPVFFESYEIDNIDTSNEQIKQAWKDISYAGDIPTKVNFVDGGIISNFPINVFHNPSIRTPRLPVIGVRLADGDDEVVEDVFSGLGSYVGAVFSTVRFNYDKEFLSKNNFYNKYVVPIDVRGFNWLNFSMDIEEQKRLFLQGVKTAHAYLSQFNWETYKTEREGLYDSLHKK